MKLVVLGSGSTVPHRRRSSAGFWLETSGGTILLDCAATVPRRMAEENLDWPNLDAIWISHFHMDHCGGLGPLLAGTKHASQMKQRTKPLRIFGPVGIRELIERINNVNNYRLLEQPFPVEISEAESLEKFEIVSGVEAVPWKTPHTDESLAIHVRDAEDKVIVYSSDTGFTEGIAALANQADLLVLECTYVRDKPADKHLELAEAIHLIRKARPQRALLTHFYPEWDGVDFAAEAAKLDPRCEVIEAVDGLRMFV